VNGINQQNTFNIVTVKQNQNLIFFFSVDHAINLELAKNQNQRGQHFQEISLFCMHLFLYEQLLYLATYL